MKRWVLVAGITELVGVLGAIAVVFSSSSRVPDLPVDRILAATRAYAAREVGSGRAMPASVTVHDLVERRDLSPVDLAGWADIDLRIYTRPVEGRPHDRIASLRLPEGDEWVAFADGSVQRR